MRKGRTVLDVLKETKANADEMWRREFEAASSGSIDTDALGRCMQRCIEADNAFFDEVARIEQRKRLIEERREACIE